MTSKGNMRVVYTEQRGHDVPDPYDERVERMADRLRRNATSSVPRQSTSSVPRNATSSVPRDGRNPTGSVPRNQTDSYDAAPAAAHDFVGQAKPILLFGGLSVAFIVAYIVISSIAVFFGSRIDNVAYLCDQTCTTHTEAFVGHPGEEAGLPSHFIGLNLRGQITVIEFPGSNPARAMTISGPFLFGKGEDKVPVQVRLIDLNADGKADLVVAAKGAQTAYLNDGAAFRVMTAEERAGVERVLSAPTPASGKPLCSPI